MSICKLTLAFSIAFTAAACGEVVDPDPTADPDAGTSFDAGASEPDAMPEEEEDTEPPETTFLQVPDDPSASRTATLEFESSEAGSTFMCKEGAGDFAACTSPFTVNANADGAQMFEVYAVDEAGNADPTPAIHAWVIDTVAPVVTISDGPSNPTNQTSASFGFTANETADFECRVDGGAWAACTSPFADSGLSDGNHTFEVRATDAAGNTGMDSYPWSVDASAPSITITSTPDNPTNATSASFGFTADAGTTLACRLAGGSFGACDSSTSHAFTGLGEGGYTFEVRATDGAGNSAVDSFSWSVDLTNPVVTILNTPNDPTNSASATFTFSVNEAGTVRCRIDSDPWTAGCTSPLSDSGLSDGTHTFTVEATDAAGNSGSDSFQWEIDTTPPTTTINGPPSPYPVDYARFTFGSNDPNASYQCSTNGGSTWFNCSTPYTRAFAYGNNELQVRASDALNNVDATPAVHRWTAERGLILHYPFERNLRNASSLGREHDGDGNGEGFTSGINNGAAVAFPGSRGSLVELRSTRVPMSNDPAYTIGLWIRDLKDVSQDRATRVLFNFIQSSGGIAAYREYSQEHELFIRYATDSRGSGGGYVHVDATRSWQHVAIMYPGNGGDLYVYVNAGDPVVIRNADGGEIFSRAQLESMVLGDNSFFGIDDLRVYNKVLKQPQVCEEMMGRLWVTSGGYCK